MPETPPDILFHRRFQRLRRPQDRELYRGKADLDRLPGEPLPVKLLEDVQVMLNTALAAEKQIPEHVDYDPFHFDYIDSVDPNALAFCCDGYSFSRSDAHRADQARLLPRNVLNVPDVPGTRCRNALRGGRWGRQGHCRVVRRDDHWYDVRMARSKVPAQDGHGAPRRSAQPLQERTEIKAGPNLEGTFFQRNEVVE